MTKWRFVVASWVNFAIGIVCAVLGLYLGAFLFGVFAVQCSLASLLWKERAQ